MTLSVEALTDPGQFDRIASEWEALDAQISPRTPFTSPLWNVLWWRHFRRNSLLETDHFFCHIVRGGRGELIAVAPLMLTHRPSFGPLRLRILNFFGADTSITELRGMICRNEDQGRALQALAGCLRDKRTQWDMIFWSGLDGQGAQRGLLQELGSLFPIGELPAYFIRLPGTWDELRLSLSSNMRKNIRKAYEFIEDAGSAYEFQVIEKATEAETALDRFFFLHASRSNAPNMIRHPNKFAAARNRAFLIEYVRKIAERGQLRIFQLRVGSTVVASRLAFLLNKDLYFYYAGYDPSLREYSVMTLLMTEALKWAIANGVEIANLSTGKDQSKLRWKPDEIIFQSFVQPSPTYFGLASSRIYRGYYGAQKIEY